MRCLPFQPSASSVGSSVLSTASTATVCRYGTEKACHWSAATISAGWGTNLFGRLLPITSALANVVTGVAGLMNPNWNFCPSQDRTRNPDGSYTSGGVSPNMDAAGVPLDPRLAR